MNTLKKDWEPGHGIKHILLVIKCLLIHPNPESALNEDAGKLIMDDYDAFQVNFLITELSAEQKCGEEDQEAMRRS